MATFSKLSDRLRRQALILLVVTGLAVPSLRPASCCCGTACGAVGNSSPACCGSTCGEAPGTTASKTTATRCCCSADQNSQLGCCGSALNDCDCEGCLGVRPADPLAANGTVPQVGPPDDASVLPSPPLALTNDQVSACLVGWHMALDSRPPPDLNVLLCVWTL